MRRNIKYSTVTPALRSLLTTVAVLSLVVCLSTPLTQVSALSVESTTAKPTQTGDSKVVGGIPTRITWEAIVGDSEEVKAITLVFPEGTTLGEGATAKATVLDGNNRIETPQETVITTEETVVTFDKPVASGLRIRVEMFYVALPVESGSYTLAGSYLDGTGETVELEESPAITVTVVTMVNTITDWLDHQPWVEAWNSVLFLNIFLNPQLIISSIPTLFWGWLRSLLLVLVGFPLAIPIGLAFSFLRMARFRIVRFFASIYVNVIRGTPLFLQIYIAFFGLPFLGVNIDSYVLGILVLAINSSSYLAEIFRAGIQSIPKGQFEASASLGMNSVQTMFSVILPQTVRRIIPTATSEFILLYKDTSLLAAAGVMEMMMFAKSMVAVTGNMTPYVVAAGFYLIVTLPLIKVVSVFERRLAAAEGSNSAPAKSKSKPVSLSLGSMQTEAAVSSVDTAGYKQDGAENTFLNSANTHEVATRPRKDPPRKPR